MRNGLGLKSILISAAIFLLNTSPLVAADRCFELFRSDKNNISSGKVVLADTDHANATEALRKTLSGKLATVLRSEWKAKLNIVLSNQFIQDLIKQQLGLQTYTIVTENLDPHSSEFTRHVHRRLFELQKAGRLNQTDDISVRDAPSPIGSIDTTFTHYTEPILQQGGVSKHQIRARSYLREIIFDQIPPGQTIPALSLTGLPISFERSVRGDSINIKYESKTETLSLSEMKAKFGESIQLYAPHGYMVKLEVKSALSDQILGNNGLPFLEGPHMVQKLDVSLTPAQVKKFFAPFKETSSKADVQQESLRRIYFLISELSSSNPEKASRINEEFRLIRAAIIKNPYFLKVIGATYYNRTAFESKTGVQITVDRDQAVYLGGMYNSRDGSLLDPSAVVKSNRPIFPKDSDARHVEFKTPITDMTNTAGIRLASPIHLPDNNKSEDNNAKILEMMKLYHRYLHSNDHSGKFNYLIKNGLTKDDQQK